MKRKIIKQGHNTLTMTIPADWAKRFNLVAGKEIDLLEKDNGLFISTEKTSEHKKTEFSIDGLDIPTIWKYFMAVYKEGYDEVTVRFDPDIKLESPYKFFNQHKLDMKYGKSSEIKTGLEFIHELSTRFVGFEIVEHGKGFAVFKEISEPNSKEFDNSLRRIFLLIQQMAEETVETLDTGNPKLLSHIHDVDINLDKFQDYCIRILNKNGFKEPKKTAVLFSVLSFLELIGDEFKSISHHLLYDFKKTNYKNIRGIIVSIKEQFDLFYDLFYKFDKEKLMKMSDIDKGRYFDMLNVLNVVKKEEEVEIFHHLRIIARYLNALTELRIEMEF